MRSADVVILTAITLEYRAVLKVKAGAYEGGHWEEEKGPNGLPVALCAFQRKKGRPLRVAVAQAGNMGAVAAANALLPLVRAYKPKCVAMSGVCAGRPGKTLLGDVVAAERLFFHDTGKRLPEEVQQDLKTYNLRDDWKVALEHFDFAARFRDETWWKKRPVPYEWQENWVLAKLREGVEDPSALSECDEFCPQWGKVLESLWASGHLEDGTLSLTDEGRKRIGRVLLTNRNRFPDISLSGELLPFKVHVAPMGSGNQVVEDEEVWSFVSGYMRKTLGLEMEAAALGALVHAQRDLKLDVLVMKGVMDFANHGRDDHYKEYSARASAECLLAFLRENLEVEGRIGPLETGASEKLPENSPLSERLKACYQIVPFDERGREEVLTELERWCDEGPTVGGRLLHAEAGTGKTRLALEWTRRRREKGWAAGFLPIDASEDWFDKLCTLGQPMLVVFDYAESRFLLREALLRVLRYAQQEKTGVLLRVRILLLARNDGDWWQSLRQADTALRAWLEETPPYELPPLASDGADRERLFLEAAKAFARKRGEGEVKCSPVVLNEKYFARVLYLHMAALASAEGFEFESNTLMKVILDHEESFWGACARRSDEATRSLQQSLARQVVAAATLRGGFKDSSTACCVAERLLGRTMSDDERRLLWLLQRIYQRPPMAPGVIAERSALGRNHSRSAMFLPALDPDLLGEGMVLRIAVPELQSDCLPSDWIDRVLPEGEDADAVSTALKVLGRVSSRTNVVRPWIARILAVSPRSRALLTLEAAKAVGESTVYSVLGDVLADRLEVSGDVELARELEAAGVPQHSVSLRRVAKWVNRTLLEALS